MPLIVDHDTEAVISKLNANERDPLLIASVVDELQPVLRFSPEFMKGLIDESGESPPSSLGDLVDIDVVIRAGDNADRLQSVVIQRMERDPAFATAIAWDVTSQLRHAMELFEAADQAGADFDPLQNIEHDSPGPDWTVLLGVLRAAIASVASTDPGSARLIIECWKRTPYAVFRRLALFGVRSTGVFSPAEVADLLLSDRRFMWPLYPDESAVPLIETICAKLSDSQYEALLSTILAGPPRNIFANISAEDYAESDGSIYDFLSALG